MISADAAWQSSPRACQPVAFPRRMVLALVLGDCVYLLTHCVVPVKAGNSRFETGFLVPARVALRNTRARREEFARKNSKVKTQNDGWHVGCKRKGRGGGAKFSQREFARDGQSQTAAIHSHKSAADRAGRQNCGSGGFICSPAVWFLLRQETAGLKPVFLCGHGWPCGTPAPDGEFFCLVVFSAQSP